MDEKIDYVLSHKDERVKYFASDFLMFYTFHSENRLTCWQKIWCKALGWREDIMFLAFRGSAKTTIVRWYVVWCIIYKIEPYIIVQSYEDTLSGAWVREVAKMLMFPKVVLDYWLLFPFDLWRENMAKSSMSSFESINGVKIEAKSLGRTIRGANTTTKDGQSTRPTLVILDDIDVEKSVRNIDIIDSNEQKLIGETMGALDPVRRRIIFLWNVINEDGIVPRFKRRYAWTWRIFEQWLYEDWECVWPEQFTPEVIDKLKNDSERSFAQNYLGVPFSGGDTIIKRASIKYANELPDGCRLVLGIDPAFSENTGTDEMWLTLTGHKGINKYVHTMIGFAGREKDEEVFCSYVESLYRRMNVAIINIEANNGWEIIGRMLKRRGLAVNVVKTTKDKVTRLREYEGCFDRGEVFFLPWTEAGVEQLLSFPHGKNDDRVDSMIQSFQKGGWTVFASA